MRCQSLATAAVCCALVAPWSAFAGGRGKPAKKPKPAPVTKTEPAKPFADVEISTITVVETRGEQAVVAGKKGGLALVRVGDALGLEELVIQKIGDGCLSFSAESGPFTLCVDAPEVPRS